MLSIVDCAVLAIVLLWLKVLHLRKRVKFPPGPKGYPVIGNVFDMMVSEIWEVARKWRHTYGTLPLYFRLNKLICCNRELDLFEQLRPIGGLGQLLRHRCRAP